MQMQLGLWRCWDVWERVLRISRHLCGAPISQKRLTRIPGKRSHLWPRLKAGYELGMYTPRLLCERMSTMFRRLSYAFQSDIHS